MLHRQNEWHFQTSKLLSIECLTLLRLKLQFARKILCSEMHCDLNAAKMMKCQATIFFFFVACQHLGS